jgi:ubiquinone/menaquinone biosynthesis C-methylase UbiE
MILSMGSSAQYDQIGRAYSATRQTDPRFAAAIWDALGDAESVLNVGAGTGSYEPPDREVIALEPSQVMIAQRPPGAAPVIQGSAEAIPLPDDSVDAAMAIISDHHWTDRAAGLREMARVARQRVLVLNVDPAMWNRFWLAAEYLPNSLRLVLPEFRHPGAWERWFRELLGDRIELTPVPVPHDCQDGFFGAYWRRPHAYLDRRVRDGISVFSRLDPDEVRHGIAALAADLESGAWEERHRDLLQLDELDLGFRVVVAELG